MEVMGLMLGEFVDDYTVRVIDVFAMPQSGTVCITWLFSLMYRDLFNVTGVGGDLGIGVLGVIIVPPLQEGVDLLQQLYRMSVLQLVHKLVMGTFTKK